MSFKNCD